MTNNDPALHLPIDSESAQERGWDKLDVVLVTGDPNIDHPSFPANLLARVLESAGFKVGIITRPDPNDPETIKALGLPRLFFGVTGGALDSMVANYTALKKVRNDDPYSPEGKGPGRPDRALTAYCNLVRQAYGKSAFIVAGGIEASLRRFAHYDFWSDSVRRPVLMDCGADALVYGMGEGPIVKIAKQLDSLLEEDSELARRRNEGLPCDKKIQISALSDLPGVVYRVAKSLPAPEDGLTLPSFEQVKENPQQHVHAFSIIQKRFGKMMHQECSGMRVIANPPHLPLTTAELDEIYALPFTRDQHPLYGKTRIPALEQVRFSITSHRGCVGGCNFCAIGQHQGKTIQSRSTDSILAEAKRITEHPFFRGVINDLGGPSANMYGLSCKSEDECKRHSCLWPNICKFLDYDQTRYLKILKAASATPKVKKLFVTTGIRTDLAISCPELVKALAFDHTSGNLKTAPEHVCDDVLKTMGKPPVESFDQFLELHRKLSRQVGKLQYVLPYLMAAHPGSEWRHMKRVREYLEDKGIKVQQCQIFTPTPMTASTVMYATGMDPRTGRKVFVEKDPKKKTSQKYQITYSEGVRKSIPRKKR